MKVGNNNISTNNNSTSLKAAKLNKAIEMKEVAEYIQKNIRTIISKDNSQRTYKFSDIASDLISEVTLAIDRVKNSNDINLLVYLKGKTNDPEVGFILSKGSYEKILSEVDKIDFIESFTKSVQSLESAIIYGR